VRRPAARRGGARPPPRAARRRGAGPAAIDIAGPTELPALARLVATSALLRRYGVTLASARAALRRARAAGDLLLVARGPAGRPVGLAWVVRSRALTGAAYLRLLLVGEGREGRGLGSALLAAAETRSRAWANHLALLVTTDNAGARRFYARHGYRHVGDLPALADPGLDEALYWKTLRPHGRRLPV
jgi:GNAT superfamily N-acetyltransferase